MHQKHTLGDGSKQSKGGNPIERMERREQRKKARDWEKDGRKQVSYERADLLPRCQNKINLAALQAPLAGSACQSIKCPINMSEQTNQQKKKKIHKADQARGRIAGWMPWLRGGLPIWQRSERLWICRRSFFSVSVYFCSFCLQTTTLPRTSTHKPSRGEVRGPCLCTCLEYTLRFMKKCLLKYHWNLASLVSAALK